MKELLQKISTVEIKDISELDSLCGVVKDYYANNKRHKYSEVSSYLMETDDIDYLLENLRQIQNRLGEYPENEGLSEKVFKLIDHITLELNRTKYIKTDFGKMQVYTTKEALNAASAAMQEAMDGLRNEQSQKMNAEAETFRNETTVLKEKVEDSYSQFVSILGIFSAVVLVFFGGMTAFNALFANMHNIGRFKLVFVTSLIGLIIFNLVFMFLYVLAKLLKREIAATEEDVNGKYAATRWIRRTWARYPYVLMFNVTMLAVMLISFAAWYGSVYCNWRI